MPSWQARVLSLAVRGLVRRRNWGSERALARRARRLFGAPRPYAWIVTRGLRHELARHGNVRGEWLIPDDPLPGVVFYVHGGGFVSCSAATHRPITATLARLTRRRVFSVEYRLAPEHRFPAAHDDVFAAYMWLLANELQSSRVAMVGDSSGGNLVLALAIRLREERVPAPACVVAISPWADLDGTGPSVRTNAGRCAMFHPENIAAFAAAVLGPVPGDTRAASPVHADLSGLPPVLLHVGSTELLLDDARRVHERIRAAAGSSHIEIYEDVAHGWQMLIPLVPEATASLRNASEFIGVHMAAASTAAAVANAP
jgi:epsilon-lactone hydrolase